MNIPVRNISPTQRELDVSLFPGPNMNIIKSMQLTHGLLCRLGIADVKLGHFSAIDSASVSDTNTNSGNYIPQILMTSNR